MLRSLVDHSPAGDPSPVDRPSLQVDRDRSVVSREHEIATILQENQGIVGFADLASALNDSLQRWADIVGEEAITFRMLLLPV